MLHKAICLQAHNKGFKKKKCIYIRRKLVCIKNGRKVMLDAVPGIISVKSCNRAETSQWDSVTSRWNFPIWHVLSRYRCDCWSRPFHHCPPPLPLRQGIVVQMDLDLGPRIVVIWDNPADRMERSWFSSSGLGLFGLVKGNCLSQVFRYLSIWDLRALDFAWLTMVQLFIARSGINSRNGCVPKIESVMWLYDCGTISWFQSFSGHHKALW